MIVVDASAAFLGLLYDGDARRLLRNERLHAPHLIDSELPQALRRGVQRRRLTPDEAWHALQTWGQMGVRRYPTVGLFPRIWDLRNNLTAYDATYVALAEVLGYPLLSADRRLAGAPGVASAVLTVTS